MVDATGLELVNPCISREISERFEVAEMLIL